MDETDADLIGHRWGAEAPGRPWLRFGADGRVSGSDGCNRLMGGWSLEGDVVSLRRMASTMMFCEGVDTWLSRAHSARHLGDRLQVLDASGAPIGELSRDQCSPR